MNIVKTGIGAALLLIAGGFAYSMDNIGNAQIDHTFVETNFRGTTPGMDHDLVIKDVVELLKKNPKYNVVLIGHTGTRGPDAAMLTLSVSRAERVKDDLIREGVSAGRIKVVGRGKTEALAPGKHETDTTYQKRMDRVEYIVSMHPEDFL